MDSTQVTRSETRLTGTPSRTNEPGQARQRLLNPTASVSHPPAYGSQASREQRVAALNFALDIGKTLNHLLNGTKRELSKLPSLKVAAPPKEGSQAKPSRPPQAAQLRKVVTASRAAASQAITRTKQRRNATSVVGKPRFGRRPPPKRAKRDPEDLS